MKSKSTTDTKPVAKSPFSGFSRFGGQQTSQMSKFGGKFNTKGIVTRPTFVTQHKGGGGK